MEHPDAVRKYHSFGEAVVEYIEMLILIEAANKKGKNYSIKLDSSNFAVYVWRG